MSWFARRGLAEVPDPGPEDQRHRNRNPPEIIVLPDNDDLSEYTKGQGTIDDPTLFSEWITGNLINNVGDGPIIVDDDGEDDRMVDAMPVPENISLRGRSLSRALSPDPVMPGAKDPMEMQPDNGGHGSRNSPQNAALFAQVFGRDQSRPVSPDPPSEHERFQSPEEEFYDEGYHTAEEELNTQNSNDGISNSDEDEDDADSVSVILIHSDDGEYVFTQGWTEIKEEPMDDVPALSLTQDTLDDSSQDTQSSTQDAAVGAKLTPVPQSPSPGHLPSDPARILQHDSESSTASLDKEAAKRERAEKLRRKKQLFWYHYAPNMIDQLRDRLESKRPREMQMNACWLYPGRRREKQGALEMSVVFRRAGTKYLYQINVGFVALFVDGLLTEEFKQGIVYHAWHASHLCGNWYCTNPRHLIAESGSLNSKRVACMKKAEEPCFHTPRCLKHLQIKEPPAGAEERSIREEDLDQPLQPAMFRSPWSLF